MSDTDIQTSSTAQFAPSAGRVRAAAALVAAAALLGAVGSLMAGIEFALATRRWLAEEGKPPSEVARARVRHAFEAGQAAGRAAAEVWGKNGDGGTVPGPRPQAPAPARQG